MTSADATDHGAPVRHHLGWLGLIHRVRFYKIGFADRSWLLSRLASAGWPGPGLPGQVTVSVRLPTDALEGCSWTDQVPVTGGVKLQ